MSSADELPPDKGDKFSPTPFDSRSSILDPQFTADIPWVVPVQPMGHPVLAWVVTVGVASLIVAFSMVRSEERKDTGRKKHSSVLEGAHYRLLIGANELLKGNELLKDVRKDLSEQAKDLGEGPAEKRLRYAVLIGEMKGQQAALDVLHSVKEQDLDDADQTRALEILRKLYHGYRREHFDANWLGPEEHELLRDELGWLGELALHPAGGPDAAGRAALLDEARRTAWTFAAYGAGLLLAGLAGLAGLFLVLSNALSGKLTSGLAAGSGNGGLYAETFAVWLLLFLGLNMGAGLALIAIQHYAKDPPPLEALMLPLGGGVLLFSLGALVWPVCRGIPWHQVRQEIGLTLGDRAGREVLIGVGCYLTAIPLVAVGLVLMLLLMQLQKALTGNGAPVPTHPIAEQLGQGGWTATLLAFVVLCVVAPLVEETMCRGVLYRHLREATATLRTGVSIVFSATVVSFLFAALHPQGVLGIPVLMGLAYAFSLAREWRGSLVSSMVAHGINNGITLLLHTLLSSG